MLYLAVLFIHVTFLLSKTGEGSSPDKIVREILFFYQVKHTCTLWSHLELACLIPVEMISSLDNMPRKIAKKCQP